MDEDAEHDEADQQVDGVDAGEEEEVLHEVAAGEGVPVVDQVHPLDDLEGEERGAEAGGDERGLLGGAVRPARVCWTQRAIAHELVSRRIVSRMPSDR